MGVFSRFLNCKNGTKLQSATLLKVTLLHGCFSRFLNCTIGAKSCKALCKVIWTLENQCFPSSAGHCSNIVNGRQTWSKDIDIDKSSLGRTVFSTIIPKIQGQNIQYHQYNLTNIFRKSCFFSIGEHELGYHNQLPAPNSL